MARRHSDTDYQPAEAFEIYKHLGPGRSIQRLVDAIEANADRKSPSVSTLKRWRREGCWDDSAAEYDLELAEQVDRRCVEAEALDRTRTINRLLTIRRTALDAVEVMLGMQPPKRVDGRAIEPINLAQPTSMDLQRLAKVAAEATALARQLDDWPTPPQPQAREPKTLHEMKLDLSLLVRYGRMLQEEIRKREAAIDVPLQ